MLLKGVLLLCAHSARSSAYVQALANAHLQPEHIIFYGPVANSILSQRDTTVHCFENLFCPDLSFTAIASVESYAWSFEQCAEKDLDSEPLQQLLSGLSPELIIYSGYGGQLVPNCILNRAPVLHVHSGHLPEYRGSTTLYHEVVEHSRCGASAILLEPTIDTGPILARETYPLPPAGIDVDYLYDNLIRADLLVRVLKQWAENKELPHACQQTEEFPPYFIIHPLLKHVALLSIDQQGQ